MTPAESKALADCLDLDEADCHKMRAAGAKTETVSSATGKALAAGVTLKQIFAAIVAAMMSGGGLQGIVAAILALITNPPTP